MPATKRNNSRRDILIGVLVATVVASIVGRMAWIATAAAHETSCLGRIASIATAWRSHEEKTGKPLPQVIFDENGKPMHSWRILLAIELNPDEYEDYDLSQPWDSDHNITFIEKVPASLCCGNEAAEKKNETSYVALVFDCDQNPGQILDASLEKFDSTSPVRIIVEMARSGIPWTKPEDLTFVDGQIALNDFSQPSIRSKDPSGPIITTMGYSWIRLGAEKRPLKSDFFKGFLQAEHQPVDK